MSWILFYICAIIYIIGYNYNIGVIKLFFYSLFCYKFIIVRTMTSFDDYNYHVPDDELQGLIFDCDGKLTSIAFKLIKFVR